MVIWIGLRRVCDAPNDIKRIQTCEKVSRQVQVASKPYKILAGVMLGFASAALFGIGVGATLVSVGLFGSLVGSPSLVVSIPVALGAFGLSAGLAEAGRKLIKNNSKIDFFAKSAREAAELTSPRKKWPLFVNKAREKSKRASIGMESISEENTKKQSDYSQ